jgi:hypothetical protein
MPFIHAALAVALLVAVWCAASALWPSSSRIVRETVAAGVKETKLAAREVLPTNEMQRERSLIRTKLEPFTRMAGREHRAIASDLKKIRSIVRAHQDSPYARALIAKKLAEIRPREHNIRTRLAGLQALTKRFLKLDASVVARLKGKDLSKLSSTEQKLVTKIWQDEKQKIAAETKLQELETEARDLLAKFDDALSTAIRTLCDGYPAECQRRLDDAIKTEVGAQAVLKKVEQLEGQLRKWVELEAKTVRDMSTRGMLP